MPLARSGVVPILVAGWLAASASLSLRAEQKGGMPDLGQQEQTCLPTSTANLIIWFGHHGYPKLILSGATEDERELHTVHAIMTATKARFDLGTRTDTITGGIEQYIHDAGYGCDVEYRGLDWGMVRAPQFARDLGVGEAPASGGRPASFGQDWLRENVDPNKGFILLLAYCRFDEAHNAFTFAIHAGHAVTLVNADTETLLIHDPAHGESEPGRKIVTPIPLSGGVLSLPNYNAPVAGLMLLSGSLLQTPPGSMALLTGAICITMHPAGEPGAVVASASGAPTSTVAGSAPADARTPVAPAAAESGWAARLYDYFFGK